MTEKVRCPVCQTALPPSVPTGFCPVCELRRALDESTEIKMTEAVAQDDFAPYLQPMQLSDLKTIRYFGDFEVLEEIGRGGMGTVFKARQLPLNRIVALKLISAGLLASCDLVKRFRAEAEIAAALSHANIVPIHEIGEHEGRHYLSMMLIEGPTLGQFLGGRPMLNGQAAQMMSTLARVVHYAHQRGVLHRDLKPSNILLDAQSKPHLTDFGLAKLTQEVGGLTQTDAVLGTPAYMSPEQARGQVQNLTTAVDVYGLGAIFYEALTGEPPFSGGSSLETLRLVLEEEARRPSLLNPKVDRDLETICLKCLAKEPGRRYPTALSLAEDLERWLASEPIRARPMSAWYKGKKWVQRKPALAIALTLALILLLILAIGGPIMALRIIGERTRAEDLLYVSDIHLAGQALAFHDLVRLRERMQRITDSPYQSKSRGWEYRFLMGRSHSGESNILGRHDSWIAGLALSSDDKWAATISEDGMVKLWNSASRQESDCWQAHTVAAKFKPDMLLHAVAFSPDGRILATGGADEHVRLWDVNSLPHVRSQSGYPRALADLEKLNDACTHLGFSLDGMLLVGTSLAGEINLWSMADSPPRLVSRWKTNDKWGTFASSFSPDGKVLLTGALGQQVRVWDIAEPGSPRELAGFTAMAGSVEFSPDGRWLVGGDSGSHFLRGYEFATRSDRLRWRECSASIGSLAFSSNGQVIATGLSDGGIYLWNLDLNLEPVNLMGHEEFVTGVAFSHDGRYLISASLDKTVRLWDVSQRDTSERTVIHESSAIGICFSRDSLFLASVGRSRGPGGDTSVRHTLKLWNAITLTEITNAVTDGSSLNSYPVFSPDGNFLIAEDWATNLRLYAIPSFQVITNLSGFAPAFSRDGKTFVYASGRRLVRRDSPASPAAVDIEIGELSSQILSLALSPDGEILACAAEGNNGTGIEFWDVQHRRRLGPVTGRTGRACKLAFSPDGTRVASAGFDGKIGIWDVPGRRLVKLLGGHAGDLYCVAFAPDGKTLASCGEDSAIRLWSTTTWEEVFTLATKSRVSNVAFSPDGRRLGAAAADGTVHVWNAP